MFWLIEELNEVNSINSLLNFTHTLYFIPDVKALHGTLQRLKWKGKSVFATKFWFVFTLLLFFAFGNKIHLLFLCLSYGKAPSIKKMFAEFYLFFIFL